MRYWIGIGLMLIGWQGFAQTIVSDYHFANVGMTFLSVNTDARSGGMGEIGVASLPDIYSHRQNAAKFAFLNPDRKGGIGLFYVPWLRPLVNDMNIAGVSGYYRGKRGQAVSASFRYFSMGDLRQTDENLQFLGERSPYEMAFDAAYARRMGKYFSMSLTFRLGMSHIADKYRKANTVAFDLGGYFYKPIPVEKLSCIWSGGFLVSNIGNKINYGPENKLFLPSELKIGTNLTAVFLKSHRFSVGVEGGKYLVASEENDRNNSVLKNIGLSFSAQEIGRIFWKVGCEYGFHDVLFGRVGYFHEGKAGLQRKYTTFGAGVRFLRIQFDAAYLVSQTRSNHSLDNSLRLSAGITF